MQKPNAVLHMLGYGLTYGFLLAMVYIWIGVLISADNIDALGIFNAIAPSAFISFLLGALPGAFFGFIDGCILGFLASRIRTPIEITGLRQWSKLSYLIIGGLTVTGMTFLTLPAAILLSSPDVSVAGTQWNALWFLLPIPIAMFASSYAVHRYFLKLGAWANVGKAKHKAKHHLTNQLAYEATDDDNPFLTDESQQQIEDTRR